MMSYFWKQKKGLRYLYTYNMCFFSFQEDLDNTAEAFIQQMDTDHSGQAQF